MVTCPGYPLGFVNRKVYTAFSLFPHLVILPQDAQTKSSARAQGKRTDRSRRTARALGFVVCGALSVLATPPPAQAQAQPEPSGQELSEVGHKLANPVSNLWALSSSFNAPQFFDGDLNAGDPEVGGLMVFQPVMPIPLHGEGKDQWRMITRPVIPFIFSEPIPTAPNQSSHKGGIGDIQLPLLLAPSDRISRHFILGAGPIFLFPSATSNDLGQNQWAMGPAVVVGYKTEKMTVGVFPNYFWKIGSAGQRASTPDISQMSLLYFFNYMLPDAWQVGFNPTITYNDKASSGNRWNVPIGLYVGRTIRVGRLPLNIKVGGEYSVISEDLFGQLFQFRLQITPVIPSLIENPILGR
jgi:hypothetical protein